MWIDDVLAGARARGPVEGTRTRPLRSFSGALARTRAMGLNPIIAELKMASPSGFRASVDPALYVRAVSGAAAFSVVTEPIAFGGSYGLLRLVASASELPILMKDFVVSEDQVRAAWTLGADAVLLIVRLLSDAELRRLHSAVRSTGMEALVEVHDERDLERALGLHPRMIGVNARDLVTLGMDRDAQLRLLRMIPSGTLRVAESGIAGAEDVRALRAAGADAFLVGTALMRNPGLLGELMRARGHRYLYGWFNHPLM
ncbi:MAG: indole-3-glycerol phosphate synthase TrpC [Conexivisphaera sp.]